MSELLIPVSACNNFDQHRIESLPIIVLHVHSRCNCRCAMCDIWKGSEQRELSPDVLQKMLPSFDNLNVRWVVLTGGEPLLHRDLAAICKPLRSRGIKVTLLTTGLLLFRYAETACELFDEIIISIDGPPLIHDRIRGIAGASERISSGIHAIRRNFSDLPLRARTVVQNANHRNLRETVRYAQELKLDSISFLAADLTSTAFNRELVWPIERQQQVGLSVEETFELEDEIESLIAEYSDTGFIAESPAKLRAIAHHFRAHLGLAPARAPMCTAPWNSVVIELNGDVRPCFFHKPVGNIDNGVLENALNDTPALSFRRTLDIGNDPICKRCVCSLNYRSQRPLAGVSASGQESPEYI